MAETQAVLRQVRIIGLSLGREDLNMVACGQSLFGAFCLVVLALRQQGFVLRSKNPAKMKSPQVLRSFSYSDLS